MSFRTRLEAFTVWLVLAPLTCAVASHASDAERATSTHRLTNDAQLVVRQGSATAETIFVDWKLADAYDVPSATDRAAAMVALEVLRSRFEASCLEVAESLGIDPVMDVEYRTMLYGVVPSTNLSWIGPRQKAADVSGSIVRALVREDVTMSEFLEATGEALRNSLERPHAHERYWLEWLVEWSDEGESDVDAFDVGNVTLDRVRAAYWRWLEPAGTIFAVYGGPPAEEWISRLETAFAVEARPERRRAPRRDRSKWLPPRRVLGLEQKEVSQAGAYSAIPWLDNGPAGFDALLRLGAGLENVDDEWLSDGASISARVRVRPETCESMLVVIALGEEAFRASGRSLARRVVDRLVALAEDEEDLHEHLRPRIEFGLSWKRKTLGSCFGNFGEEPPPTFDPEHFGQTVDEALDWEAMRTVLVYSENAPSPGDPSFPAEAVRVHPLTADPDRVLAISQLEQALAELERGEAEAAVVLARSVVRLAPDQPLAWTTLGDGLRLLENPDEALVAYRRAERLNPESPRTKLAIIETHLDDMGEAETALRQARRYAAIAPRHLPLRLLEARALHVMERGREAIAIAERAMAESTDDADAWGALGHFHRAVSSDGRLALRAYVEAIRRLPIGDPYSLPLAELVASSADVESLLDELGRVEWDDEEERFDIWCRLGQALNDHLKAYPIAVEVYGRLTTLEPERSRSWALLGNSLLNEGLAEQAVSALRRAVALDSDAAWSWKRLGDGLRRLDLLEEAVEAYRSGIRTGRGAWIHRDLARTLADLGRWEEARESFEEAVQWHRNHASLWSRYALFVCRRFDDDATADNGFHRAFELAPESVTTHLRQAKCFEHRERDELAMKFYRRATQLDPRRVWGWNGLARTFVRLGRPLDALDAHRSALESIDDLEDRASVLNNLAWNLATELDAPSPEQLAEALQHAEEACRISERSNANYLDTLAEASFRMGRQAEAIEVIEEALALGTGDRDYLESQKERFVGESAPPS